MLRTAAKAIIRSIPAIDRLVDHLSHAVAHPRKLPPMERWKAGLPSEVNFWRRIINGTYPNREWVAEMRRRVCGQNPFPDHLHRYLDGTSVTRILDVGAGPITILGPIGAPSQIEVVGVDPLADTYNTLLDKQGLVPCNRTLRGEGEHLSELELGLFDLVYSRNALDHAYDPIRAIREMTKLCKASGAVFFEGNVNESCRERGVGLHQWNFMPVDNGDLVVWQMNKKATSLRSALGENLQVQASGSKWYKVEIRHQIWGTLAAS